MFLCSEFRDVMSVMISAWKWTFDSSLPPVVCRRAHVLFMLFMFAYSGVQHILCCVFYTICYQFLWIVHFWMPLRYSLNIYYAPAMKSQRGILIYPCPSVCLSGYRSMVCPAISSYNFGATPLIFCRMFIHIMDVCMFTGFWFSSNILKMTRSWT